MQPQTIAYSRRSSFSPAVDEPTIRAVVQDFYREARRDSLLGPVFEAHVADWDPHLEKMVGFWASVVRGERRYAGNPVAKHQAVQGLGLKHFRRWLDLFSTVLRRHCSREDADAWEATARRTAFAMSHRLGLGQNEDLLP